LLEEAQSYRRDHPDTIVLVYDTWAEFTTILDHPSHFGFVDTTNACYGSAGQVGETYQQEGCSCARVRRRDR